MELKKAPEMATKLIEGIVRLGVLVISIGLLFTLAYILGFSYLQKLYGNDSFNALNNVYWLARWWPRIPYWYPGQGAGVSFVWGYPLLPSLMVMFISFWQKINLTASFKVLGFISLPITAGGMYFFVWRRLKNQTAALISAIFYLLMPISWIWLFDWGFYSEHIAYIFIFPTLLFFDRFLDSMIEGKINRQARLSLLLAVLLLGLTFATHPLVFFAMIRIIGLYAPICFLVKKKKLNFKNLIKAFFPFLLVFTLAVLSVAFLVGNYWYYVKTSGSISGLASLDRKDFIYFNSIPTDSLLGLRRISHDDFKFTVRNAAIPMLVWAPAIGGTVLALFLSAKVFSLALAGWLAFLLLSKPELVYFFLEAKLPLINYLIGMRHEVLILKMTVPIVAAFGIGVVPSLFLKLATFWLRFKSQLLRWGVEVFKKVVASGFTLGIAGWLIFYFANKPLYFWQEDGVRYGPYCFNIRDPLLKFIPEGVCWQVSEEGDQYYQMFNREQRRQDYLILACEKEDVPEWCQSFLEAEKEEQAEIFAGFVHRCEQGKENREEKALCPLVVRQKKEVFRKLAGLLRDKSYWPKLDLTSSFEFPYNELAEFNRRFGDDQFLRLDVSPALGGITQSLNMFNQASMINLYTVQLNLLGPYWGYQQQVMYSAHDQRVETMNELAKWFGTRFLLINSTANVEALAKIKNSDDWQDWDGQGFIWEYKQAPRLWTLTQAKPTVLVIGDLEKRAFEPVFRAANKGALPYDNFWLVQGNEYVDRYSLAELQEFDILMLFGYKYKNRKKAYRLLDSFVKNGGSLFVSSGWQYVDQIWQAEKTPDFFPAEKLSWTDDFDQKSIYQFDSDLMGAVDISSFGPLVWSEKGWGTSVASGLKPWARLILSVDGQPLVIGGKYGEGKVILSGLNLIGHMHDYGYNQSEKDFFKKIFEWLGLPATVDLSGTVIASRDFPDRIEFVFKQPIENKSVFYLRESFFPSWKARLVKKGKELPLKINKAGPNFKLINLPSLSAGDTLLLEFKPGARHWFLVLVSVVTLLGLVVYMVLGKKIYESIFTFSRKQIKSMGEKMKKNWDEE